MTSRPRGTSCWSKLGVAPHNRRLAAIVYLDHARNGLTRRQCGMAMAARAAAAGAAAAQLWSGVPGATHVGPLTGDTTLTALQVRWRDRSQCAWSRPPYWPARVVPPKRAPNVLLIMTDDVSFAAPSRFGGVIPTPNLDRIASSGLCSCAVLLLFGVRQRTYLSIRQPQLDPGQLFEFVGVNGHDL